MTAPPHDTLGVLADRIAAASRAERVSVADLVSAIGPQSFLPMMLVPALLAATPLSGIPGVSAVCGIVIAVVAFQVLASRREVRLPGPILRKSVSGERLRAALERSRPVIDWIDRRTRKRLTILFHRPLVWLPALICLASGLAMPFLEVIPFSASTLAVGVFGLTLSLLTRDRVLFLVALTPYGLLGWLVFPRLL